MVIENEEKIISILGSLADNGPDTDHVWPAENEKPETDP